MWRSGKRPAAWWCRTTSFSLAIGKEGQNARLAAKLTGWKIDIKSQSQAAELMALSVEEAPPYEEESLEPMDDDDTL